VCRHLLCLLSRFARLSRDERPDGRLPAFAWGDVALRATPILSITIGIRFFHRPVPAHSSALLTASVPRGKRTGLPRFAYVPRDGLGPAYPPVAVWSATAEGATAVPGYVPFGPSLSAHLACVTSRRLSAVHLS
jgi:hypothetical protein